METKRHIGYTTQDLLLQTAQPSQLLGQGNEANVYRFPEGMGFDGYALRVRRAVLPRFKDLLTRTTSLSPVPRLVADMEVGQPLMALDADTGAMPTGAHADIEIILHQPGVSFRQKYDAHLATIAAGKTPSTVDRDLATLGMMDDILAFTRQQPDKNLFLEPLKQSRRLRTHYIPDVTLGNILIDEVGGKLRLVDQQGREENTPSVHEISPPPSNELKRQFSFYGDLRGNAREDFISNRNALARLIDQAEHLLDTYPETAPLAFANVRDTSACVLAKPPQALLARLDALRSDAGLRR